MPRRAPPPVGSGPLARCPHGLPAGQWASALLGPTSLSLSRSSGWPTMCSESEVLPSHPHQAKRLGVAKDRIRLKDATHIIAKIAVPSTIRLVAREQLLAALRPFAAERVAEEETRAEAIRVGSADAKDEERLLQRVTHLRAILTWADDVPRQADFGHAQTAAAEKLRASLALAHWPTATTPTPATAWSQKPDARWGKHDGYLLDVATDADSEIVTALNVLPAKRRRGRRRRAPDLARGSGARQRCPGHGRFG